VNLLLDTSIVIHVLRGIEARAVRERIALAGTIFVSAVSILEIAIKVSIGKLRVDMNDLLRQLPQDGFAELAVSWRHSRAVHDLPLHHRDPFDRLLVAQAIEEPMQLLTHDALLGQYSSLVIIV
jgi:PIN domain nuclease of toxin-antitoxin system